MATNAAHEYKSIYINGNWHASLSGQHLDIVNPADEAIIGRAPAGGASDIEAAVGAARAAFDARGEGSWASWTCSQRATLLRKIGAEVAARKDKLALLETLDTGKPLPESDWDVDDVAGCFEFYAEQCEELETRQCQPVALPDEEYTAQLAWEPVGVVGAIIPWNYPLLMAAWKLAPALAAGCAVVLKPSELTPMTALELAAIVHAVGETVALPRGVVNVVTGTGADAGAALVQHPGVDKVAFTGSLSTGREVMARCAQDVKVVSLELGGKSPSIVFADADLEKAVEWVMFGVFWTNGQICSSTSRLLIDKRVAKRFVARLVEETRKIRIGDPTAEGTKLGPLVSRAQQQKVLGFVERAVEAGARLLCGGGRPASQRSGWFVEPTVLEVEPSMEIWQEEVFGPVLSVVAFDSEADAVQLANASRYGLGAAVFSSDDARLQRVTRALQAGIVWNNCSQPCFTQLPWGGFKQSGIGRELGRFGLDGFLEPKQICKYVSGNHFGWYFEPTSKL